jgi:O-antigen ligase
VASMTPAATLADSPVSTGDQAPKGALRIARALLWLAVVVPFVYSTSKTAAQVSAGGSVGMLEYVRGGGPLVLWAMSVPLAPTVRRWCGVGELALIGYCAVIVMSTLIPENPSPHGTLLKSFGTVFVFLAMGRLVRLYPTSGEVLRSLVGLMHVLLLAAVFQLFFFKSAVYRIAPNDSSGVPRLNSVIPSVSANPLALIAVAGILSVVLNVAPRWLRLNVVTRNLLLVLYVYVILLTRTRSALAVGLLVIILSLVIRMRRHPLSTLGTFIVVTGGVLVLSPSLAPQVHDFLRRGQTSQGIDTLTGRTDIWASAMRIWHENEFFGLGYYTGHRLGIPGLLATQSNIDNTWLETLVDVGLVGIVPLAVFVLVGGYRLLRTTELSGDLRLWAAAVFSYVFAISFINPTIQSPGANQVVMGVLVLACAPRRHLSREPGPLPARGTPRADPLRI